METESAYQELLAKLKRLDRLGSIGGILSWDDSVNLPPRSSGLRGEQQAVFTEIFHREAADPRFGELIEALEATRESLSSDQQRGCPRRPARLRPVDAHSRRVCRPQGRRRDRRPPRLDRGSQE
jgi:Zn-dependent M32 family carboxypeptidase